LTAPRVYPTPAPVVAREKPRALPPLVDLGEESPWVRIAAICGLLGAILVVVALVMGLGTCAGSCARLLSLPVLCCAVSLGDRPRLVEGVRWYRHFVSFRLVDGRRRRWVLWSPGWPWVRSEAARMLAEEVGVANIVPGSARISGGRSPS